MGQYYTPTLIDSDDTIRTLYSFDFDSGMKLMEHSWIGNEFVNAVLCIIDKNPHRVAWIGDYSDELDKNKPELYHSSLTEDEFSRYYKASQEDESLRLTLADLKEDAKNWMDVKTEGTYLVNHTKNEYLDIGKYIQRSICEDDWCVHPLPLLTACGNDRGGGDFHEAPGNIGYKDIGAWAFDVIEYTDRKPPAYKEALYTFIEE